MLISSVIWKRFLSIFLVLFTIGAWAQAPEGINYQAVIRKTDGTLVANTTVAVRVQIKQNSAAGTVVYSERQSVITSQFGLINFVIGQGTLLAGTFSTINWSTGNYWVNLAVDFANGTNYVDYGSQRLMSTPYALYAKTAGVQLNQWRYGTGAPAAALGNVGDFYLDPSTGNVYYKSAATTWTLTGNIAGPAGTQGAQGPIGLTGATGPQGPAGPTGSAGLTGPSGATGPQGPAGPTGLTGPQGPTGATGPQGIAGTNGNTVLNGILAPSNGQGVDGDFYINTASNFIYGPKANGIWPSGVSLVGPQGPAGATGLTGAAGATGPAGPQGLTGATGPQGPAGFLANGASAGNTPYWNGTQWIVNSSNIYNNGASVGVGTVSPNASAALEVNPTTKGFLLPTMTQAQRNAIATPATGLLIYQSDQTAGFYYYNGTAWNAIAGAAAGTSYSSGSTTLIYTTDGF